jgi:hypothetical protein
MIMTNAVAALGPAVITGGVSIVVYILTRWHERRQATAQREEDRRQFEKEQQARRVEIDEARNREKEARIYADRTEARWQYREVASDLALAISAVARAPTQQPAGRQRELEDLYKELQRLGRGRVEAAFGRASSVRWAERRIRNVLDAGRQRAIDVLSGDGESAAKALRELGEFEFALISDRLLDEIFSVEADAAIAKPGEVLETFVSDEHQRAALDRYSNDYGGHRVDDAST